MTRTPRRYKTRLYSTPSADGAPRVDRAARIISGFQVIRAGEVRGRAEWVDAAFLDQIAAAGNGARHSMKCRFTHPSLFSDPLGKFLGRASNFRREGDVVRADLHLSETTKTSPVFKKDPAEYIMDLTDSDPAAFGASIVFEHDHAAEAKFQIEHGGKDFRSPDPANTNNYRHVRLARLWASDVVDESAATDGFFSGDEKTIMARIGEVLDYAFGYSDRPPVSLAGLGVPPEHIRQFLQQNFARRRAAPTPAGLFRRAATALGLRSHETKGKTVQQTNTDRDFVELARARARETGASFTDAMSALIQEDPEGYKEYQAAQREHYGRRPTSDDD